MGKNQRITTFTSLLIIIGIVNCRSLLYSNSASSTNEIVGVSQYAREQPVPIRFIELTDASRREATLSSDRDSHLSRNDRSLQKGTNNKTISNSPDELDESTRPTTTLLQKSVSPFPTPIASHVGNEIMPSKPSTINPPPKDTGFTAQPPPNGTNPILQTGSNNNTNSTSINDLMPSKQKESVSSSPTPFFLNITGTTAVPSSPTNVTTSQSPKDTVSSSPTPFFLNVTGTTTVPTSPTNVTTPQSPKDTDVQHHSPPESTDPSLQIGLSNNTNSTLIDYTTSPTMDMHAEYISSSPTQIFLHGIGGTTMSSAPVHATPSQAPKNTNHKTSHHTHENSHLEPSSHHTVHHPTRAPSSHHIHHPTPHNGNHTHKQPREHSHGNHTGSYNREHVDDDDDGISRLTIFIFIAASSILMFKFERWRRGRAMRERGEALNGMNGEMYMQAEYV